MDRAWGPQMNGAIRRIRAHIRLLKKPETIRSKIGANQREQHQNFALLNDKETLPIWAGEKIRLIRTLFKFFIQVMAVAIG